MANKRLKYKGVRKFIDTRAADSYIHVSVEESEYGMSFSVKLADCNRHINLYFPATRPEDRQRSLKKLNNVLEPLLRIREELERLEGEGG